jgi:dihydrolipoamide dehydrogenase
LTTILQADVAIIGSGPGGYVAAIRAGQLGLKTVVVEKEDKFGGTCLHWGCIPTKALLFEAELLDYFKNSSAYGITGKEFQLDWQAALQRKSQIVTRLAKGVEFLLKKNNVVTVHGLGKLAGNGKVVVEGAKNGRTEITARNIVLATGSEAGTLPGLAIDPPVVVTNREILELKSVPKSLIVIGGGAVGVEFASIFQRLGARVTLLEMLPRILPLEDEEISSELEKALRKQGIAIHTSARVERAGGAGKGAFVEFTGPQGKAVQISGEVLLVAVGRAPNTRGIGLEAAGLQTEKGAIRVNPFMQTGQPGIYAIGDIVAASPLLAHVAEAEGIVAVTHAAGQRVQGMDYRHAPNCTYCEPEVASAGMTEQQARARKLPVRVGKFPFSANSKAAILGAREGFVKVVTESKYGEILGVHMIGPRVTELIAEAVVAMKLEATAEDLANVIHPHPTLSEAILEAAHAANDQAIHV